MQAQNISPTTKITDRRLQSFFFFFFFFLIETNRPIISKTNNLVS